jgi:glycosyltransferase involved in cell wall biosynthesis
MEKAKTTTNESKKVKLSVLIPVKNEELNLPGCLESLRDWADEIVVVDSQSNDHTIPIAESFGAKILQFHYKGGWPKKRQWALDSFDFQHEWILLLDADEILLEPVKKEIETAIQEKGVDGFRIRFQIHFLGRVLKHGDNDLWKVCLFRKGRGRYENRLAQQDISMGDMEVHEHIMVNGKTGQLHHPIRHENLNRLDRYIDKHNAYSNWEARVWMRGNEDNGVKPCLWGGQAGRRRWLKKTFMAFPGSPLFLFIYKFFICRGFMDGIPGLIYCLFQSVYIFHIKAKMYEIKKMIHSSGLRKD